MKSQQIYTRMLSVSPVREEDLRSHLLRFLFYATPVKKGQHARRKPGSVVTNGEHKLKECNGVNCSYSGFKEVLLP